jgi:aerobic-type carbon monoxide dehydrogenase small subunit (CoxS/CutS family)
MKVAKDGDATTAGEAARAKLSRRGFLLGAPLAAAAAPGCLPAETAEGGGAPIVGPGAVPVTLRVNRKEHAIQVEPRRTLADVLRDELGLTGTKVVCDRGSCSACTVWLDGTPVVSCLTFVLDAAGHEITTIEGLARGEELHPVQAAFIEHDAMQCGFCTPGMVMSCAALLQRNPSPSLDDVRAAVSGNLCRCGTYPKVFAATLAAARSAQARPGKGA